MEIKRIKYICHSCKKEVEVIPGGRIICPHCANRTLEKPRTGTVKHVKAR